MNDDGDRQRYPASDTGKEKALEITFLRVRSAQR